MVALQNHSMELAMKPFSLIPRKRAQGWIGLGVLAIAAMQIYYVREIVAAFIIFTVLFTFGVGVVLMVFLLDRAAQRLFVWAELGTRSFRLHSTPRLVARRRA